MTYPTTDELLRRAQADARTYGYYLNPDPQFLQSLMEGLKQNVERYGYHSCPCRLASGVFDYDRDILCPCDYRDPDVAEYGACYCALYVSKDIYEGKTQLNPVPERRPVEKQSRAYTAAAMPSEAKAEVIVKPEAKPEAKPEPATAAKEAEVAAPKKKMWYCKQCGYVVFRDDPPYVCPICKAKKEFFAEIKANVDFNG